MISDLKSAWEELGEESGETALEVTQFCWDVKTAAVKGCWSVPVEADDP